MSGSSPPDPDAVETELTPTRLDPAPPTAAPPLPPPSPPPSPPTRSRRGWTRWLRPPVLVAVLIFFAFPFLTVACDTPGGFGRVAPGGETRYPGYGLAFGLDPVRTPADKVLAVGVDDRLGAQPLLIAALALVVAALAVSILVRVVVARRIGVAALAGAALVSTVVSVLVVRTELVDRVAAQLSGRDLPAGRTPASYVSWGAGFTTTVVLLGGLAVVDLTLVLLAHARGRPDRPGP